VPEPVVSILLTGPIKSVALIVAWAVMALLVALTIDSDDALRRSSPLLLTAVWIEPLICRPARVWLLIWIMPTAGLVSQAVLSAQKKVVPPDWRANCRVAWAGGAKPRSDAVSARQKNLVDLKRASPA
jgi:hypothetical protein